MKKLLKILIGYILLGALIVGMVQAFIFLNDLIFGPPKTEINIEEAFKESESIMREVFGPDYKPMSDEKKRLLIENPEKFKEEVLIEGERFRKEMLELAEEIRQTQDSESRRP